MKRGDVVIAVLPGDYGKARPAVVVQVDRFIDDFDSILVCPMTTHSVAHPVARIMVSPTAANGLLQQSWLMVEKTLPLPKARISRVIGQMDDATVGRLSRSLATLLGTEQ
jgi:mRNA interferase MazF